MEKLAARDAQAAPDCAPSVVSLLYTQPHRFDFEQAIRILEACAPGKSALGEGGQEAVRVRSHVTLSPVGTQIQRVTPGRFPQEPATLTVNFLSIAGIHGPLPTPYTELLLEQTRRQQTGMRDFLDVFNHRLAALWYRARTALCLGADQKPAEKTTAGQIFFDLVGLDARKQGVHDEDLLIFPTLFWSKNRSAMALVRYIEQVFGVPTVRLVPNQGRWMEGDRSEATRLGCAFHRLGQETILGRRSWCQSYGIRLHLLDLTWAQYQNFLPGGSQEKRLTDMLQRYTGLEARAIQIRLGLKAGSTPRLVLGQGRLGRSLWLNDF